VRQHVQQEEKLTIAYTRQSGREAAGGSACVLVTNRLFVALPVLPVGWIGDQRVEGPSSVAVI
jgi:hypothetical protein